MVQNMMVWFFDNAAMLNDSSSICELFQLTELSKLNTVINSIGKIISPIILSHSFQKTIGQLEKRFQFGVHVAPHFYSHPYQGRSYCPINTTGHYCWKVHENHDGQFKMLNPI